MNEMQGAGNKRAGRFTPAVTVIILFGVISLLGDAVYESARGANSQYFDLLGISAAKVGLVFGIGEFLGYFLRLLAGVLSDRSRRHWLFMFLGYGMLLVVPLMGFTGHWNVLIVLILMERIGKALRNPAKDTIVSAVSENQVGIGFAFGLQEALDQIGAFAGPLIFTAVFYFTGKNGVRQYQTGYNWLFVPFGLLMLFLVYVYRRVKRDGLVPPDIKVREFRAERLQPIFWVYTAFTFACTLGFVNFSTIGYHLKAQKLMADADITLLYSAAMAVDALTALLVGKAYDRMKERTGKKTGGLLVLAAIPPVTLFLPFLTMTNSTAAIVAGMMVFGVVMGTHETIMRSAIADITPFYKRGTGYGVFNSAYGLALLGGSSLMGKFYDLGRLDVITVLTCAAEAVAVVLYFVMHRMVGRSGETDVPQRNR